MRRQSVHEFARIAVTQLAQKGFAAIDVMRLGDRPIAALIRFDHGGMSIPWKVAFDEEFAAFSPGKQLMCDETRRWLADPTIERVDPVCEEDNPLMPLAVAGPRALRDAASQLQRLGDRRAAPCRARRPEDAKRKAQAKRLLARPPAARAERRRERRRRAGAGQRRRGAPRGGADSAALTAPRRLIRRAEVHYLR